MMEKCLDKSIDVKEQKLGSKVSTSWGEDLTANREGIPHGNGDFIVYANKDGKPNPDDRWVVNGMVFENTYEEA